MLKGKPLFVEMSVGLDLTNVAEYTPPFDATVVKLLQGAGASIFGKTNCDEFGMGCVFYIFKFLALKVVLGH